MIYQKYNSKNQFVFFDRESIEKIEFENKDVPFVFFNKNDIVSMNHDMRELKFKEQLFYILPTGCETIVSSTERKDGISHLLTKHSD